MDALLTTIVLWLSANFDLPAIYEHPRIEFASSASMVALRDQSLSSWQMVGPSDQTEAREIVSVYDDRTKALYLPEVWNGNTPAEVSILVHEMVHHLQNVGNMKFACPQVREQIAYKAQEKWLGLFGRDLYRDFEIDPFTLLVKTNCAY
jgi:hypothetical protein